MSPDWMFTRVMVVLIAIIGPIYFFLLMWLLPFQMAPFPDPFYNFLFHYLATPIIFSLTWVGWIYYARYRLANTMYHMDDTIDAVPLRWRIFYGSNAAFVVGFFVLPMLIPLWAIISGVYVALHLYKTYGKGKVGTSSAVKIGAILFAFILCILPTVVAWQFLPGYLQVWEQIMVAWSDFWFKVVYGFAQCLVNALSFGAPIYFIYFGAQEYDKGVYGTVYTETPSRWIRFMEMVIFITFLVVYLPPIPLPFGNVIPFLDMSWIFTSFINYVSLAIVAIMILVKWRVGVSNDTTIGGPLNIFIVGLFLVVELFFKLNVLIVTLTVWLAFILFAIIFLGNYTRASSREMY